MNETMALLTVLLSAVFTSNILLTNYLGMCSFLAVSKEIKTSLGLGVAVVFVMTFTCPLNWMINAWVLVPLQLDYLMFITFIVVIAAFVQVIEMIVERVSETLYANLGIFLPLITVNCAILGAALFMIIRKYTLAESFVYWFGSRVGWAMAILAMAGIRQEKLNQSKLPRGLEGPGIALVVAGIMALAFMGFSGMGGAN
jgi:Na+-transporting NADH:ubiquinone oxidoreductase subunit E